VFRFFQMDLSAKFKLVTSCQQIKITSLRDNTAYPIERAERVQTKCGEAIILTLQESSHTFVKVFLPKRYGSLFTENDLHSINVKSVSLNFKYIGTSPDSNTLHLGDRIDILVKFPDGGMVGQAGGSRAG